MAGTAETSIEWSPPRSARRWTEEQGRAMVAAMRKTGGTAGAFARRHGLQEERVRRWVRRVEGRWQAIAAPAAGPTVTFAPVGVIEAARSGSPLEVVVGECVVRVGHGFDAELLRQVVSALRGEGC